MSVARAKSAHRVRKANLNRCHIFRKQEKSDEDHHIRPDCFVGHSRDCCPSLRKKGQGLRHACDVVPGGLVELKTLAALVCSNQMVREVVTVLCMTADTLSFAKLAAGSDFFVSTIFVYSTKSFCVTSSVLRSSAQGRVRKSHQLVDRKNDSDYLGVQIAYMRRRAGRVTELYSYI
jgi:hypothetical protein